MFNLQVGDCIGRGASGSVYRALDLSTGRVVAVKQIILPDGSQTDSELSDMMNEISLLSALKHPNIVQLIGHEILGNELRIIMELCENGSLHDVLKKFGPLPENLAAMYLSQVLDGLEYLHSQGVAHRDIKSGNILTTKGGIVKLADFGLATNMAIAEDVVAGSGYWLAPEVIELRGVTCASDIWSVGATAIELVTGSPPYYGLAPVSALFRIVNDEHPDIPTKVTPGLRHFLLDCFQKDPNLRISAKDLKTCEWLLSHHNVKSNRTANRRSADEPDEKILSQVVMAPVRLTDFMETNDDFDDFLEEVDEKQFVTVCLPKTKEGDLEGQIQDFHSVTERLYDFDPTSWLQEWLNSTSTKNLNDKARELIDTKVIRDLLNRKRFTILSKLTDSLYFHVMIGSHLIDEFHRYFERSPSEESVFHIASTGIFRSQPLNDYEYQVKLLSLLEIMSIRYPTLTLPQSTPLIAYFLGRNDAIIQMKCLTLIKNVLDTHVKQLEHEQIEISSLLIQEDIVPLLMACFRELPTIEGEDITSCILQIVCYLNVSGLQGRESSELMVRDILAEFRHLDPNQTYCALKVLHKLSFSAENLEILEFSGTIDELCHLLKLRTMWKSNTIMICLHLLFSLLRLNKSRQRRAVERGIIPVLSQLCHSPLERQLAIPILCEIIHHDSRARSLLFDNGGSDALVQLLGDICWRSLALESLTHWLAYRDSSMDLEQFLLGKKSLCSIKELLNQLSGPQMGDEESLFRSLQRIVSFSIRLAQAMIRIGLIHVIVTDLLRFDSPTTKTYLLKTLERIACTQFLQDWKRSCDVSMRQTLQQKLKFVSESDISVIVRHLSRKVYDQVKNMNDLSD